MRFLIGLLVAIAFTAVFRVPIKKLPGVFYLLATMLSVLLIFYTSLLLPPWFYRNFLFLLQSNTLGMGLLTIVMFIGVLDPESSLRKLLAPIRAELSIIASLICIGHVVNYGKAYLDQLLNNLSHVSTVRAFSMAVALILVLLLIPLAVTSIRAIHMRMSSQSWRRIQRLAYPFYGLVFIHLMFFLLPPALAGGSAAQISIIAYLVIAVAYVVLRLRRYFRSRMAAPRQVTLETTP